MASDLASTEGAGRGPYAAVETEEFAVGGRVASRVSQFESMNATSAGVRTALAGVARSMRNESLTAYSQGYTRILETPTGARYGSGASTFASAAGAAAARGGRAVNKFKWRLSERNRHYL